MKKWTQQEDELLKKVVASQNNLKGVCSAIKLSKYLVEKRMLELNLDFKKDEIKLAQIKQDDKSYRKKFENAVTRITELEKEIEANIALKSKEIRTYKIEPLLSRGDNEATAVALLSDWHYEETVKPQSVNYLNKFDENIAIERIQKTFQTIVKYIKLQQNETNISQLVLGLLGDFISGGIHDELKEGNSLQPTEAIWKVENHIASGINFILDNTNVKIIVPCCSGNHARITEKQRTATESGHSLEWLMYKHLEQYFSENERVEFIVNDGYLTYVNIYGFNIRFHHGHSMRFQGGVGGIYIPVNKAIAQWNKQNKADIDCFGHFHQMRDGGTFISNGSLIGLNAFAIKIKADFELPKQAFFMVDKKYKLNLVRPIILSNN